MKWINMGLNTEPPMSEEEFSEVIKRFEKNGSDTEWRYKLQEDAIKLKQFVIDTVEAEGCAELNWSCSGETRFHIHSCQWANALPQYRFEIARYSCKVYKE